MSDAVDNACPQCGLYVADGLDVWGVDGCRRWHRACVDERHIEGLPARKPALRTNQAMMPRGLETEARLVSLERTLASVERLLERILEAVDRPQ